VRPNLTLTARQLSLRDKAILAGLYLAKYDSSGLRQLGFANFVEAFNVIGTALGVRPSSVKNYRDEFDPLFPNGRKGWHRRPRREYCKVISDTFGSLSLDRFTELLKFVIYKEHDLDLLKENLDRQRGESQSFAKRLLTGQAAEQYFRSNYKQMISFHGLELEDTTNIGCGFDFKLSSPETFYGVEVKGLNEPNGTITLTEKEYAVASVLRARFFLCVVKNFRESPFHELYRDPLNGQLSFERTERRVVQALWATRV
jgi:Protein NO VEIN, C-terminal